MANVHDSIKSIQKLLAANEKKFGIQFQKGFQIVKHCEGKKTIFFILQYCHICDHFSFSATLFKYPIRISSIEFFYNIKVWWSNIVIDNWQIVDCRFIFFFRLLFLFKTHLTIRHVSRILVCLQIIFFCSNTLYS